MRKVYLFLLVVTFGFASACQSAIPNSASMGEQPPLKVLAVETFLADIAQNVAGDRLMVETLMPIGIDPHEFEPTPSDLAKISSSRLLIIIGGGMEGWLEKILVNAGGDRTEIVASSGLASRKPSEGEPIDPGESKFTDPHFWLDPTNVIRFVENIRDGFTYADPQGRSIYAQNAAAYISRLKDLDVWINQQVAQIPPPRRLLVTNHESLGYFADRYGFKIVGAIIPSVSSESSPSAQQLAELINQIKQTGAPAIFLETGANDELARQIAEETDVKVITGLYTHSIAKPGEGPASYLDMMKLNVNLIVEALK
jgi:ABC-type Zn uptake system ZnuABC Zn-binding protein ZnuA